MGWTAAGGSSGTIAFSGYIENFHNQMLDDTAVDSLDFSITDIANTAWGTQGNPYDGEEAYDSDSQLQAVQDQLAETKDFFDDRDAVVDWKDFVDAALDKVDSAIMSDEDITDAVDAFETSMNSRQLRSINRFTGGMMDINAVNSSAFIIGMSLIESDMLNEIATFEQRLRVRNKELRNQQILQAVNEMFSSLRHKIDSGDRLTALTSDVNRLEIIAKTEQTRRQLELDEKEALWDFEVMQRVANTLASVHGSTVKEGGELSAGQSFLSGAAAGVSIGSNFGPVGAGIGAVAGGIIGLL